MYDKTPPRGRDLLKKGLVVLEEISRQKQSMVN